MTKANDPFVVDGIEVGNYDAGTLKFGERVDQCPGSPLNNNYVPDSGITLYIGKNTASITPRQGAKKMTFINFDQANVFGQAYIDNDTEAQKKIMQAKREDVKQCKGNYFSDIKKDLKTGVKWTSQKKQWEKMVNAAKFSQDKICKDVLGSVRYFDLKSGTANYQGRQLKEIANQFTINNVFAGDPVPDGLSKMTVEHDGSIKQKRTAKVKIGTKANTEPIYPKPIPRVKATHRNKQSMLKSLQPVYVDGSIIGATRGQKFYYDDELAKNSPLNDNYVSNHDLSLYWKDGQMHTEPSAGAKRYAFKSVSQIACIGYAMVAGDKQKAREIYSVDRMTARHDPNIFYKMIADMPDTPNWNQELDDHWHEMGMESKVKNDPFAKKAVNRVKYYELINRYHMDNPNGYQWVETIRKLGKEGTFGQYFKAQMKMDDDEDLTDDEQIAVDEVETSQNERKLKKLEQGLDAYHRQEFRKKGYYYADNDYHATTTTSRENTVDPDSHDANHVDYWKSIESTKSRRVNYNSSFAKPIQKKSSFKPKPIPEGYVEHGVDINHGFDNTLQQNAKQSHNGMDTSLANLAMNNIQDQDDSNGLSADSPMF